LLLSLLNDILDLAKIEAGRIEIHPEISSLKQAFEDTCTLFAAQADSKALTFSFTLDASVPAHVITDIFRLRQVMANLISNAVKYTERGHVDVLLTTRDSEHGPLLCFSVTDTGRGIPKESLGLVFDKFTQIHRSAAIGGTGLGLPICQSLVELMGGRISVESAVGQGSTFSFWIPLVPVTEADAHIVAQLDVKEDSHVGCKVLLAEDVEINQFVITEMLEGLGCSVTVAENGQVALDKAISGNFDVVFMDCNMPVMDGYTAARRLREAGFAALPIIAVTAHALADEKQKCLDAGMSDFVSKPVRKHDLARILDQWHVGSVVEQPAQAVVVPAEPDFDPAPLVDWLKGPSPEKAKRMIELTLKDSARLYSEIETAVASRDAAALADSAHALKSVSAQIGAIALSALCRTLEKKGKAGELEDIHETFSKFTTAYERAVQQINNLQNNSRAGQ
jgi:CheY-like chemotaxis protein